MRKLPGILECHLGSGDFDYLIKARIPEMNAYRKLLGDMLLTLPGARESRSYIVMEEIVERLELVVPPEDRPAARARVSIASTRPWAARMVVVVHDGLRLKASSGSAWATERLAPYAAKYGNHAVWREYTDRICRELMAAVTAPAGYAVRVWESYATGHEQKMVHMLAVLERETAVRP